MSEFLHMNEVERENRRLKQLLVDADAVARKRGDKFGLCNSILRDGEAYPSHAVGEAIRAAQSERFAPCLTLDQALHNNQSPNSPWRESLPISAAPKK